MAAVLLESPEKVATCAEAVQEVREKLDLPADFEFHFARIKDDHRRRFLSQIAKCEFFFVGRILDKSILRGKHWQNKPFFYEQVIGALVDDAANFLQAAQQMKGTHLKARVTADDNEDPVYFKILGEQFKRIRAVSGKPLVEKVRPGRSRSSALIQLADMVCGAVVRWHEGDESYLKLIRQRGRAARLFEKKESDPPKGRP